MEDSLIEPMFGALEAVDKSEASVARLLHGSFLARALARWIPGFEIRRAGAGSTATCGTPESGERFGIVWRSPQAELTLRVPWSLDVVTASVLAAQSWSPQVQLACVCARANSVLKGLLDWMGELGLHPVELERRCAPLMHGPGDTVFKCRAGGHWIQARVRCLEASWAESVSRELARRWPIPLQAVARLTLPVRIVLGTRRLRLGLCRSLGTGDVLLLDRQSGPENAIDVVHLLVGTRGNRALSWPCSARGREVIAHGDRWMNAEMPHSLATHEDDMTTADGRKVPDPMADVEVEVHLELQVLSTPLGELAAMQPGYVLELPVPAAQACVELVVGGRVHGRAQLVRVGDRLGARILELFRDPA